MTMLVGWTHHQNLKLSQFPLINEADVTHQLSTAGGQIVICAKDFLPIHTYSTDEVIIAVIGYPRILHKQAKSSPTMGEAMHAAYLKHGESFIEQIKGEFSLFIIDSVSDSVLLYSDRKGTYPITHSCGESLKNGFAFGNSLKTLQCNPLLKSKINKQSIYDYLYFHTIPSPQTIYEEYNKLPPASFLHFNKNQLSRTHYWTPTFTPDQTTPEPQLEQHLLEKLSKSVSSRIDNAQVGCFLSGGLDSSTVAGLMSNTMKETHAFSIGFKEEGYDETEYAKIAAKQFNLHLHTHYITTDEVIAAIDTVTRTSDEPFGNSSAVPTFVCAKLAKDAGFNTLLAGDGGDELFAGNDRYAKQKLFEVYTTLPNWVKNSILEPMFLNSGLKNVVGARKINSYITQARLSMPARTESYNLLNRTPLKTIFKNEFLASIDSQHPEKTLQITYDTIENTDLLNRMLYLDWKITLADNDIRKVNMMCESAGMRVRYPMLDDELIEFSTTIPSKLKLKGQNLRYFYKNGVSNLLPKEIINKKKHGFGLPFGAWLKKSPELQEIIYGALEDIKRHDIFCPEFIDNLIETQKEGHASYYGTMVWVIAMLSLWLKENDK